jgi:hypothetical protein
MFHRESLYLIFLLSLVFTQVIEVIIGSAQEKSCGGRTNKFWKALSLMAEQLSQRIGSSVVVSICFIDPNT